jgi:D-glycero-D-manno-heptose 1,7-bisphosphate phosphatase
MSSAPAGRPRQAVILAGGRGTRLGALGERMPKAMVPFGGKPFLAYLLQRLREQGFERVLMLLGYKAEQITGYCGDGAEFGLRIDYSVTAVEDDTGRRVKLAESKLEPHFLLMYCDNAWPLAFERMWADFASRGGAAQVTVYRNRDGYTRNNVRVGTDGMVEVYDKSRTAPDLQGVDIGFLVVDRAVVRLLPEHDNISFEQFLYPQLIAERKLAAFETDHRYYSVSTPERLAETERFLTRAPCVILDRDGVLNAKQPKATWVTSPEQWRWLPGALDALARLTEAGIELVVVTNQAGIARGGLTASDLEAIHARMKGEAAAHGAKISTVYACPHDWDSKCDCRKPKAGMLLQAQRQHALDLSVTPFVGDDERDGIAAAAAGCPFFPVDPEMGLAQVVAPVLDFVRAHQRKSAWEPC